MSFLFEAQTLNPQERRSCFPLKSHHFVNGITAAIKARIPKAVFRVYFFFLKNNQCLERVFLSF